jgi:tetratricopeptide (TPR) repeat protein
VGEDGSRPFPSAYNTEKREDRHVTEVDKRAYELLGYAYLEGRKGSLAMDAFDEAGVTPPTAKLLDIANCCLEEEGGNPLYALRAFRRAGVAPPMEKLVEIGSASLNKGCLDDALEAYKAVGLTLVPKEKLVELGNAFLEKRKLDNALEAFKESGVAPPKHKLVDIGNAFLEEELLPEALKAFKAADAKKDLVACGNACLERRRVDLALEAFQASGVTPALKKKLVAIANAYLHDDEYSGPRKLDHLVSY